MANLSTLRKTFLTVYITGNQNITGVKNFANKPTVNGVDILLSGEVPPLPETIVYTTGNQTIGGRKRFFYSNPDEYFIIDNSEFNGESGWAFIDNVTASIGYSDQYVEFASGYVRFYGSTPTVNGTPILLSGEAPTLENLQLTGQNLQNQIDNLDLNYASDLELSQTGSNLQSQIDTKANSADIYNAAIDWTTNHTLADGTRYLAGDLVYVSGKIYKANFDNESIPVTSALYWTDLGNGYRLNIDGRDIPNIPISLAVQTGLDSKYDASNPSGFITGIDLSNYATLSSLELTGQNLQNQTDSLSGAAVLVYGDQYIDGQKIFRGEVRIKDLYVTGTETIVNTTNTNVGSNYILLNATGGAIDAGIFIVTGNGLTGISDTGAVIGYDVPANRWVFGNTSRNSDLSQLDQIAGITDITNYSGFVNSNFYSINNPNGYITGIDLSSYATISNLELTGQNLQNQFNNLTGVDLSPYYLKSNPSGFITGVDLSQYLTGVDLFPYVTKSGGQFTDRPTLNGTGFLLSGEAASLPSTIVYTTGNQTISGAKIFATGVDILNGASPQALRIFNSSGTNSGEFGLIGWQNNNFIIGPQQTNSGILRNLILTGASIDIIANSSGGGLTNRSINIRAGNGGGNLSRDVNIFAGNGTEFNENGGSINLYAGQGRNFIGVPTFGGFNIVAGPSIAASSGTHNIYGNININNFSFGGVASPRTINIYRTGLAYGIPTSLIGISIDQNNANFQNGMGLQVSGIQVTPALYVNTTSDQVISGVKTFINDTYIRNLYVTGTQTIVNTTNTNVASNYLLLNATGGARDAGIFIVTGLSSGTSGVPLTGANDLGAIIGYDVPANQWVFGTTTRNSDLSTLAKIASTTDITNYSGFVDNTFYTKNNPSGFITGVDLSPYATVIDLNETGSTLNIKIDNLSGYSNNIFATITNLETTGSNLNQKIDNLSGVSVLIYGNQTISGLKDFATRPTVNTFPIALSGEAASNIEQFVKNDYGSTLYKAQPVYVSGANGNNILIHPASNSGEGTSSKTFGLLKQTLLNNEQGYVVTEGALLNVNTSMATEGDPVWLGPTGNLIFGLANKPKAPQHLVSLGFVERAHQTQGKIFVKVQNGFEIEELHDVRIVNKQNSDIIIYNSGSGLWLNSGINFGSFYTKDNPSGFITGIDLSNYITSSQTGSFYTNDNPSGFITGLDTSNFYLNSNPSGFITGLDLSIYATISNLELTGQNLQNQIDNFDLNYASDSQLFQTGSNLQSQIDNLYNSGFITGVDLSNYYTKDNPSGFITGVDLSNYVTGLVVRPEGTGNFYTKDNPSGFITNSSVSKIIDKFTASSNQPPVSGFATLDTRSSVLVLDYDDTVNESGTFIGMIPETAGTITGLRVRILWTATTATGNNCRWGARFADLSSSGVDAPFAIATEINSTANSISGRSTTADIVCSGTAGLSANEFYRLLVYRNSADTVNDTMVGDAELVSVTTYLT